MKFEQNIALQQYNTLAVPSTAEYFFTAPSEKELLQAFSEAVQQQLPVSILGGGSNVLLPNFVPGLVLQPGFCGSELAFENSSEVIVRAKAATNWHQFVCSCLQKGYFGLENLSYIPGSVGAAPIQNIGAYGVEVSELIAAIHAFDCQQQQRVTLLPEQCDFAYRDSIFKSRYAGCYIILAVDFRLSKQPAVNLNYPALQQYFANTALTPTPAMVAQAVITIRQSKLPQPEDIPNAGSFFKNPLINQKKYRQLKQRFPQLVAYSQGDNYKVAAGWLIEQAGWKGKAWLEITMHTQQALVLTNKSKRGLDNILLFAERVQRDVQRQFDLTLEIEPQILGALNYSAV